MASCSLWIKDLAYSNAIAVTSYPHETGNIGHYQMADGTVGMMSQPPIGGTLSWLIYEKYQEAWFLEEVFDNLLQWNEWWLDYRLNQDYLAWGGWPGADAQIAAWESGLDNAPMYQGQQMLETENAAIHQLADVGLNSLYVSDCQHLAKMADVLGRKTEAQKLRARAKRFAKKVESLWVEEEQAYLNRNLLTQQPDPHLAPPLFYPLIAKIPSPARAQAFLKAHYHNEEEFSGEFMLPSCAYNDPLYDNIYWQGAIWPPLNFLVYLGLREYDPKVAGELAQHSYDLFLEAWQKHNYVFENINSAKGVADPEDQLMTDPFYHWGALMGVMQFMEAGWYDTNQDRLKP
ncbi:MAG: trehalase family glycosidase [Bacteroidota bacterium]